MLNPLRGKKVSPKQEKIVEKEPFEIVKVKWEWPEAVKNKEVYRDDEYVVTESKAEALKAIDFLMHKPQGSNTYTITVERDGKYYTYYRHSMPCLGGLVKYRVTHGRKHYMNPYFPRDIRVMFPQGNIIFIAVELRSLNNMVDFQEFLLSNESPWISAFGSKDTLIFRDNHMVLTNMDADPTVLYSFFRLSGFRNTTSIYQAWHPKARLVAERCRDSDLRRIAGQKPIKISGGTWAQGYGYTRPYNDSIFKPSINITLKEFGSKKGCQSAYFDCTPVLAEIKKNFNLAIDPMKYILDTEENEKICLRIWDYYKSLADSLSDLPGF